MHTHQQKAELSNRDSDVNNSSKGRIDIYNQ